MENLSKQCGKEYSQNTETRKSFKLKKKTRKINYRKYFRKSKKQTKLVNAEKIQKRKNITKKVKSDTENELILRNYSINKKILKQN